MSVNPQCFDGCHPDPAATPRPPLSGRTSIRCSNLHVSGRFSGSQWFCNHEHHYIHEMMITRHIEWKKSVRLCRLLNWILVCICLDFLNCQLSTSRPEISKWICRLKIKTSSKGKWLSSSVVVPKMKKQYIQCSITVCDISIHQKGIDWFSMRLPKKNDIPELNNDHRYLKKYKHYISMYL